LNLKPSDPDTGSDKQAFVVRVCRRVCICSEEHRSGRTALSSLGNGEPSRNKHPNDDEGRSDFDWSHGGAVKAVSDLVKMLQKNVEDTNSNVGD